ncbi:hypothetical protein EMCRGX_G020227 [Ephydatia muelleri]
MTTSLNNPFPASVFSTVALWHHCSLETKVPSKRRDGRLYVFFHYTATLAILFAQAGPHVVVQYRGATGPFNPYMCANGPFNVTFSELLVLVLSRTKLVTPLLKDVCTFLCCGTCALHQRWDMCSTSECCISDEDASVPWSRDCSRYHITTSPPLNLEGGLMVPVLERAVADPWIQCLLYHHPDQGTSHPLDTTTSYSAVSCLMIG